MAEPSVARTVASVLGGRVLATGLQAATLVLIARIAGPEDFAIFAAVFGILQLAQAVSDLGATGYIYGNHWRLDRIRVVLHIGLFVSMVTGIFTCIALLVASAQLDSYVMVTLFPLGIWLAAERASEVRSAILIASSRTRLVGIALSLRRAFVMIVTSVSIFTPAHWGWYFSSSSAVSSVVALLVLAQGSRSILREDTFHAVGARHLKTKFSMVRELAPFWSSSISQQIRQLDVAILTLIAPGAVLAYAPASRLGTPLRLLPAAYGQVLLSRLASQDRLAGAEEFKQATVISLVAYIPLTILTPLWVPLVLGELYSASVLPIAVVCLSLIPFTYASVLTSGLQAVGQAGLAASAGWVGGISLLVLIAPLAALLGATGAALANIASSCLALAVLGFISLRRTRTQPTAASPS